MRKFLMVTSLSVLFLFVFVFYGSCTAMTGAGAINVIESLNAFAKAMERFENNIERSVPWREISLDDALPLDPVSQFSGKFRPLFNLGVNKDSMERDKKSFNFKSVTYDENENEFRIVCEYTAGGGREIYEGTYDPMSDRLKFKKVWYRGTGELVENLEVEYMKTDFGYVARFYDIDRSVIHKLAIKGDEGIVSWGETKFDTLYASLDFPKEGRMWYEISGDRFIFQPWDGPVREYAIKK
jgi:hypothetical protein